MYLLLSLPPKISLIKTESTTHFDYSPLTLSLLPVPVPVPMNSLPDLVLLHILSRLDDSADVARCRVASKAFNTVFPDLRSINLKCSYDWYLTSTSRVPIPNNSERFKSFKNVFLDLISELENVESMCITLDDSIIENFHLMNEYSYLTDGDFVREWMPRVSGSLKSLSISDYHSQNPSDVLRLISTYCHNLVNLKLEFVWMYVHDMNPMPLLTSLTLNKTDLVNEELNLFNKCFPNLQVLNVDGVNGLTDPKIHLVNLKTCFWDVSDDNMGSLTLITPNLITLIFKAYEPVSLHVEAPLLSHFHLGFYIGKQAATLTVKKLLNLKTLILDSYYVDSLLSQIPLIKTVENLTLDSMYCPPRLATDSKLALRKVFTVFPNVSSLCIKFSAWKELEAWSLNPEDWEILDGRKGLKSVCVYLNLDDPSLTFLCVARVLDQCVALTQVSLLTSHFVDDTVLKSFMSKCITCWPSLKFKWGIWNSFTGDIRIINAISN